MTAVAELLPPMARVSRCVFFVNAYLPCDTRRVGGFSGAATEWPSFRPFLVSGAGKIVGKPPLRLIQEQFVRLPIAGDHSK